MPSDRAASPVASQARCLVIDGDIACVDDLCHGNDTTLCGLERYVDFETDEFDDDLDGFWDDEEPT